MHPEWKECAECLSPEGRWSTHVSTDKPIYRQGDTFHIRAVVLHPITGEPVSDENPQNRAYDMNGTIQVISPKESVEATMYIDGPMESVMYNKWSVPEGLSGGEYTLRYTPRGYSGMGRNSPPAERRFQIRAFRSPKLNVRVEFLGRGYGPGDEVRAKVSVTRAEGGAPPAATPVTLSARVDGAPVHTSPAALDDSGVCYVTFSLPPEMKEGLGALNALVSDGGTVESGSKTIPIVLQTVNLEFFPEGGVLVPGLENRVYFEARDPTEEPVDIAGEVWAVGGNAPLATFAAVHEGCGNFVFTPIAGQAYEARITKPGNIKKPVPLPAVEEAIADGLPRVVLRVDGLADAEMAEVEKPPNPEEFAVDVTVASAAAALFRVVLYKREVALDSKDAVILSPGGSKKLSLHPPGPEYAGVLRVTVFAEDGDDWTPVAERLLYRVPEKNLHVAVSGGSSASGGGDCVPGEKARVEVAVTDAATGEPVTGAVVGLSVVDNSNLEQVEPRRRPPRLPAMALLEDEVAHLDDSGAYIDGSDLPGGSDPSLAVDLLLGTQGWRRFLYRDPLEKLLENGIEDQGQKAKAQRAAGVRVNKDPYGHSYYQGMAPGAAFGASAGAVGGATEDEEDEDMGFSLYDADESARPAGLLGAVLGRRTPTPAAGSTGPSPGDAPPVTSPDEQNLPEWAGNVPEQSEEGAQAAKDEGDLEFPFADLDADVDLDEEDEADVEAERAKKQQRIRASVRVFAHERQSTKKLHQAYLRSIRRSDFTETVYFAASLVTDARGRAAAEFDLSDSITSFAVIADAHKAVEFQTEGETITTTVTRNGTTVKATAKGSSRTVRTSALGASNGVFKIRSVKPWMPSAPWSSRRPTGCSYRSL
ncbi:hypothetical protein KFL_000990110 [Klebsormidium nitens]|uniref:Macroglobulin domain-containing protein n=1 Tax=Klebsormidium nitens TaxID=105231 RepID=A0A1Y1HW84_KLENI|nr:hypothetical protein KFL_000990110 [Klebsormidium nitens]|eukprot:GAQ82062.1 hypothetical protein KFL_000990110 [Klebsormidium nitens]